MTAVNLFLVTIVLATLIFLRVYGPHLIEAVIESRKENERLRKLEQDRQDNARAAREIARIDDQLKRAFGGCESREIEFSLRIMHEMRALARAWLEAVVDEDATTELFVAVEWFDDEIDLVFDDETLTDRQKCEQIAAILERNHGQKHNEATQG